jgi:hypothetical protein
MGLEVRLPLTLSVKSSSEFYSFNEARPHQGRWCFGKTPMQTYLDAIPLAQEKLIAA